MRVPICPNGHKPDYFSVPLYDFFDDYQAGDIAYPGQFRMLEVAVLMAPDGTLTNNYSDGIAGVSSYHRELANDSDSAICFECYAECDWTDA